jgi:hypothetical protein
MSPLKFKAANGLSLELNTNKNILHFKDTQSLL